MLDFRFDGAWFRYTAVPQFLNINLLAGQPRQFSLDSTYVPDDPRNFRADLKRYFYGANVDIGPLGQDWSGNAYYINQMVNGVVDRRAVGTEVRYASNCLVILPGTSTLFLNPNATTDAPCSLQALPGTGNIWTYTAQAIGANFPFDNTTFVANASYISSPAYRGQSLTLNSLARLGQQWQFDTFLILCHQTDSNSVELYRVTPTIRMDYRFLNSWTLEASGGVGKTLTDSSLQKDSTLRQFFFFGLRWDFS